MARLQPASQGNDTSKHVGTVGTSSTVAESSRWVSTWSTLDLHQSSSAKSCQIKDKLSIEWWAWTPSSIIHGISTIRWRLTHPRRTTLLSSNYRRLLLELSKYSFLISFGALCFIFPSFLFKATKTITREMNTVREVSFLSWQWC